MRNHMLRMVSAVLVLGSALALYLFGIAGIGREGPQNWDGRVLYAAGRTWVQHGNPYDHDALARSVASIPGMDLSAAGFFYPPQAAAICVPFGLMSYESARILWLLVNLAALVALVVASAIAIRWDSLDRRGATYPLGIALVTAVILGNPFSAHVVWMGQTTLVAVAALFGAWLYTVRGRWLLAGLCLGLACYKPQICVLVVLWLVLEKQWWTLVAGAATAAVMAIKPMITQGGPLGALMAWRNGVNSDYALPFNLPSFSHKIGVESLLYAIGGLSVSGELIMGTGLLLTLLLWRYRKVIDQDDIFSLLLIITLTFSVYLHDYDYVALIPAFASLWRCAIAGRKYAVASAFLLSALFLPQRLMREFSSPILDQWRAFVVVMIAVVILSSSVKQRAAAGSAVAVGSGT